MKSITDRVELQLLPRPYTKIDGDPGFFIRHFYKTPVLDLQFLSLYLFDPEGIFNDGRIIAVGIQSGDHITKGTAHIRRVEDGRRHHSFIDPGDGHYLGPYTVIQLIG